MSIKQWDIYILLNLYYNGAPEPIITKVIECVSKLISLRGDTVKLALPAVKPNGRVHGFNSVFFGS